jgi:serine/threonine protein phosphatase PrpC
MTEPEDELSQTIPISVRLGRDPVVAPAIDIVYAGLSHVGRFRRRNEDAWNAAPELGLFAVADGLGGHQAGNVASRVVVEALPEVLGPRLRALSDLHSSEAMQIIIDGLAQLSADIGRESRRHAALTGMGSTLVVAAVRGAQALLAHIGDSRGYRLREGHLEPLTRDHSVVQYLLDTGAIVPEQVSTHPARAQITRYVGMPGDVRADVRLLDLRPGDRLLLCTDGLTGMVAAGDISELLATHGEPAAACQALVDAALAGGGLDNITVLVLHCRPSQAGAGPT